FQPVREPAALTTGRDAPLQVSSLGAFLEWQRATESAVTSYFNAQRSLLNLLTPENPNYRIEAPTRRTPRRSERNVVLAAAALDEPVKGASGRLIVDESHPYFFDHPLDHVPGILILEGTLQLVELLVPDNPYVASLDLSFKRFCEKDRPTILTARPISGDTGMAYRIQVSQDGVQAAVCDLGFASIPRLLGRSLGEPPGCPARATPDPRYLHKHRPENVLVTELEEAMPGQRYCCDMLPPPGGHILDQGGTGDYSLLYLLETTRQFVMLLAHLIEKIPLGMPINLASIRVSLTEPVPRGDRLRLFCSPQPIQRLGQMTLANIAIELHSGRGKI